MKMNSNNDHDYRQIKGIGGSYESGVTCSYHGLMVSVMVKKPACAAS